MPASTVILRVLNAAPESRYLYGRPSEWLPEARLLDETLNSLVRFPRDSEFLVDGMGNYGNDSGIVPCHPRFRSCRLSVEGQRVVLNSLMAAGEIIIPTQIQHAGFGELFWDAMECWWQTTLATGLGKVHLGVFQRRPGDDFDERICGEMFVKVRSHFDEIKKVIRESVANGDAFKWRPFTATDQADIRRRLDTDIRLKKIKICADNGECDLLYCSNEIPGLEIEAMVNVRGLCDSEDVYLRFPDDGMPPLF